VRQQGAGRHDARFLPAIRALGFADVPSYLADRHVRRHLTIKPSRPKSGSAIMP